METRYTELVKQTSSHPPQWAETEIQLACSLRLFESGQSRLGAARTHVAWGAVCREQGDFAAAQREASGLTCELERTHALLDSLTKE